MHLDQITKGSFTLLSLLPLALPTSAFFRLPCRSPVVVQRADPIVNPGAVSGHLHTIMGGNAFGFEMDYNSTQASTCSTCIVKQDKSNYWVPSLFYKAKNGTFMSVKQTGGMLVYYLQRQDAKDPGFANGLQAFPPGFTVLAGNPALRSYTNTPEQRAVTYACLGTSTKQTNGFPNIKCPNGLRSQIFLPSCWDGVKYWEDPSLKQKDHLTYPSGVDTGHCSAPFNKRFISIFYEVLWDTNRPEYEWYGDSQPFVWSNGDPTGYGYHGDFLNGWDTNVLQKAITKCTSASGVIQECDVFDFYDDQSVSSCSVPSSINEQVSGLMNKLPGCNDVQYGPANAAKQSNCGAPTTIGAPNFPFTDLISSRGFQYVGCGMDFAGQPRTLKGARTSDRANMTIEKCVDFCTSKGFSIAGVEYAAECYCDNTIPQDRLPTTTVSGKCNMPCTGNGNQVCGGWASIGLYQKCTAGDCVNNAPLFINGSAGSNTAAFKDFNLPVSSKSSATSSTMQSLKSTTSSTVSVKPTITSSTSSLKSTTSTTIKTSTKTSTTSSVKSTTSTTTSIRPIVVTTTSRSATGTPTTAARKKQARRYKKHQRTPRSD